VGESPPVFLEYAMAPSRLLLAAALALATCAAVAAPKKAPNKNDDCLTCHADPGLAKEKNPLQGLASWAAAGRETLTLAVAKDALAGSAHEGLGCTDCHAGIKDLPHGENLPPVQCGACHDSAMADLAISVHRKEGAAAPYAPSCMNCHGAHQIHKVSDPRSSASESQVSATCGACHGDQERMKALGVRIANPYDNYMKSEHGKAAAAGKSPVPTCAVCHGSHKILKSTDPQSPVNKARVPDLCGTCHDTVKAEYDASVHGKALKEGNTESPSCTNCHGEHDIESAKRPTSKVYPANIAKTTCPQCHASVRLGERYALNARRVESYQGSFHGLANTYGKTNVANCASCHGIHNIRASADPASSINPKNLQKTCGQCHPGSSEAFARMSIHENASISEHWILDLIKNFYVWIIALTLGGMGLHQLLDLFRRYRDTIRRYGPVSVYIRMTFSERVQHVLLLSSFLVLTITGFALKYPGSVWGLPFRWIPGGFEARSLIHRIAAVVMVADSLFHLAYLAFTARGRKLALDMLPKIQDVKDALAQMAWYLGLRRRGAEFSRFNYAEKAEYGALVWGTIVMTVTGLVLWFKVWVSRFLPVWGYAAAEIVHFYEAVLAFSAIVIWHFYAVFLHTDSPPFNPTWITGTMTREMMEHNHPKELDALDSREGGAKK
jgi:cytochrome b subunit of formate dehydrogenase